MFLKQKYGGITKYFCELMKNLPEGNSYDLSVLFSGNQYLKDYKFKKTNLSLPDLEFRGKGRLKTNFYQINKLYSEYKISMKKFDVFHPTYYDPYFLKNLKKPYVITVHDLIEFKFQEQYKNESLIPDMEKVIRKANRIISISKNTKKDLIQFLNISPDKIDVIYHGFNLPTKKPDKNNLGRYILFVGVRTGYKNFSNLAKAYSILRKHDDTLNLVCVGQPFLKNEIQELKSLQIFDSTSVFGVNEEQLNEFYANALAFIYPSMYEGFGMPVLEAFANSCPVCLSNTSSLPEVAGNAAEYFDPTSRDSILEGIKKVIYNKAYSEKLVEEGEIQLKKFSWINCATSTAETYQKAIS